MPRRSHGVPVSQRSPPHGEPRLQEPPDRVPTLARVAGTRQGTLYRFPPRAFNVTITSHFTEVTLLTQGRTRSRRGRGKDPKRNAEKATVSGLLCPLQMYPWSEPAAPSTAPPGCSWGGRPAVTAPPRPRVLGDHRRVANPSRQGPPRCTRLHGLPHPGLLVDPSSRAAAEQSRREPRGPPGLTLEGGPFSRLPVPAPLHEAHEVPTGPRPGSAHGRQLGAVALHHLHHDAQDVLLICKGKAPGQGGSAGLGAVLRAFRRKGAWGRWQPFLRKAHGSLWS